MASGSRDAQVVGFLLYTLESWIVVLAATTRSSPAPATGETRNWTSRQQHFSFLVSLLLKNFNYKKSYWNANSIFFMYDFSNKRKFYYTHNDFQKLFSIENYFKVILEGWLFWSNHRGRNCTARPYTQAGLTGRMTWLKMVALQNQPNGLNPRLCLNIPKKVGCSDVT